MRVAIVGGGVAGLGAAWRLRGFAEVELFEAAGVLGGRATTRHHGPAHFDHGAQFFRTETPLAEEVILRQLPGAPMDIPAEVRPFTADGTIGPGDPAQNGMPKWVYPEGIGGLATRLARDSGAQIHLGAAVQRVELRGEAWSIETQLGTGDGFDAVVVALPPGPATRLVEHSGLPATERAAILQGLAGARHRPIVSIALGFREPVPQPSGIYALVNTDRAHAISWLAWEVEKPGYVPPGHHVLIAQMSAGWTTSHAVATDGALAATAAECVAGLIGPLPPFTWFDVTRWAEALPDATLRPGALRDLEPAGLFFAGDLLTGGRVHLALESGISAADRLLAMHSTPTPRPANMAR